MQNGRSVLFSFTDAEARDKLLLKALECCIYPVTVVDSANMQIGMNLQCETSDYEETGLIVNPG